MMKFTLPGFAFATSSAPLEFNTDGVIFKYDPANCHPGPHDPYGLGRILAISIPDVMRFNLKSIPAISLFGNIDLPAGFRAPRLYDGTQELGGKKTLVLMMNGWGDTIRVQPALRGLFRKGRNARPPRITVACNWTHNFPYANADFIDAVRPNILTFKELCDYDLIASLLPDNFERTAAHSMCDAYCLLLGVDPARKEAPQIDPDPRRVERIRPALDALRQGSGKRLLCVNWRSRFPHKNAPAELFFRIAGGLERRYQAVLFKDEPDASLMQGEIDRAGAPVVNLSHLISDLHDTVAALSLVDAFVSVDTGIVHAAGALGLPGVALFGPFPPATHVADYPTVLGLRARYRGRHCVGPCLETHKGCAELDYSTDRISPCFLAFEAEDIIRLMARHLDGHLNQGRSGPDPAVYPESGPNGRAPCAFS